MEIDICTTATCRPELYEQSLKSFAKYVKGDFRLLLNIDPVGPGTVDEVEAVARAYFSKISVFKPDKANFQLAQLRLWSRVTSTFFFNLEDDWEFKAPVDVDEMVRVLQEADTLALLRLPKWSSTEHTRQWNKWEIPWNGRFFEIPAELRGELGFSGHPSVIRARFLLPLLEYLDHTYDLEKQLKGRGRFGRYLFAWQYGVWQAQHSPATIKDIGTPWRREKGWMKNGSSKFRWFSWVKTQAMSGKTGGGVVGS